MARPLPDHRTWRKLRETLDPVDRKRIERETRRFLVMEHDDDAYLSIAYARHLIRFWEWGPLWITGIFVAFGFVFGLLVFRDPGEAARELFEDSWTWMLLGFWLPYVQLLRLRRAEERNLEVLWRATSADTSRETPAAT